MLAANAPPNMPVVFNVFLFTESPNVRFVSSCAFSVLLLKIGKPSIPSSLISFMPALTQFLPDL
ncbi:hypothetical protein [Staphylococcus gallinarum]|uniref:hypothetical protein n=1 Tax=Staphylococcus gallinarum TaxID=1293 RepID=UPI0030B97BFB